MVPTDEMRQEKGLGRFVLRKGRHMLWPWPSGSEHEPHADDWKRNDEEEEEEEDEDDGGRDVCHCFCLVLTLFVTKLKSHCVESGFSTKYCANKKLWKCSGSL
jgi:hypothetical protein